MNTRYSTAVLGFLGCLLIGRSVQGHEEPRPSATASGGVQLVHAGAAAPTTSRPCWTPTGTHQTKVTAGKYCVCDTGSHQSHDAYTAPHLALGEVVEIRPIDWVTRVKLGNTSALMNRSADSKEFTTLVTYEHKNSDTGQVESVLHAVRITPLDPAVDTMCDKTKNVLKLTFCFKKKADGKWACEPGDLPGGHLGDTHVEN